jgi:hypothetical protein
MKKLMFAVVMGLFIMGLGSISFAGMLDQAVEATEQANRRPRTPRPRATVPRRKPSKPKMLQNKNLEV